MLTDLLWYEYVFIGFAGVVVGIINTLAGSGSLITLPIFIFLVGLPAPVANGTNRIGAFLQSLTGIYAFSKTQKLPIEASRWLLLPTLVGAALGSWIASQLDKEAMFQVVGYLMVVMLVVLLIKPKRWITPTQTENIRTKGPLVFGVFFLIGVYGGFIQAGVGIFLLAALVLISRFNLTNSNIIKLILVLLFNIPTLIIFFYYNQVNIGWGLFMAVCQSVGAVLGVRFITKVPNANIWIHRLLILIVVISIFRFFGIWEWLMGLV